jgi:hypothetical protein
MQTETTSTSEITKSLSEKQGTELVSSPPLARVASGNGKDGSAIWVPHEILLRIFVELDAVGLVARVSKDWNAVANDDLLWEVSCNKRGIKAFEGETLKQAFVRDYKDRMRNRMHDTMQSLFTNEEIISMSYEEFKDNYKNPKKIYLFVSTNLSPSELLSDEIIKNLFKLKLEDKGTYEISGEFVTCHNVTYSPAKIEEVNSSGFTQLKEASFQRHHQDVTTGIYEFEIPEALRKDFAAIINKTEPLKDRIKPNFKKLSEQCDLQSVEFKGAFYPVDPVLWQKQKRNIKEAYPIPSSEKASKLDKKKHRCLVM